MSDVTNILIGVVILILGIPIGNYLARVTKEELKGGKLWFKALIVVSLMGAIISLILKNDAFLFSFLFISIVTSRSLIKRE